MLAYHRLAAEAREAAKAVKTQDHLEEAQIVRTNRLGKVSSAENRKFKDHADTDGDGKEENLANQLSASSQEVTVQRTSGEVASAKVSKGTPEFATVDHFRVILGTSRNPIIVGIHEYTTAMEERMFRRDESSLALLPRNRRRGRPKNVAENATEDKANSPIQQSSSPIPRRKAQHGVLSGIKADTAMTMIPSRASSTAGTPIVAAATAQGIPVGIILCPRMSKAPTIGNIAPPFMPWQEVGKSPFIVLTKFTKDASNWADEEEEDDDDQEDLDHTQSDAGSEEALKSWWGGGTHGLPRFEALSSGRSLCVPRNSPAYRPPRHSADSWGSGSWGDEFNQEERRLNRWGDTDLGFGCGGRSPYGRPRKKGLIMG